MIYENAISRWYRKHTDNIHKKKLKKIRKTSTDRIDNSMPFFKNFAKTRNKTQQFLVEEREKAIASENKILLEKINSIIAGKGKRLVESEPPAGKSLNYLLRKQDANKIIRENQQIVEKIQKLPPQVDFKKFDQEFQLKSKVKKMISKLNVPKAKKPRYKGRTNHLPPLSSEETNEEAPETYMNLSLNPKKSKKNHKRFQNSATLKIAKDFYGELQSKKKVKPLKKPKQLKADEENLTKINETEETKNSQDRKSSPKPISSVQATSGAKKTKSVKTSNHLKPESTELQKASKNTQQGIEKASGNLELNKADSGEEKSGTKNSKEQSKNSSLSSSKNSSQKSSRKSSQKSSRKSSRKSSEN